MVGTGDLPLVFTWLKDDVPLVSNVGQAADGDVMLESNIHGSSSVSARQQQQRQHEPESRILIRQNDEFTSALSISSITRSQGGTYKCIVENDAAKETYSAILRVNGNIQMNIDGSKRQANKSKTNNELTN